MKEIVSGVVASGVKHIFKLINSTDIHAVQFVFTGAMTALVADLEGSLDGVTFFSLGTKTFSEAELTAKAALLHVTGKLVEYVRINITTYTGTGAVTVYYTPATSDMRQVD
jgi:hypothetical protein